MVRTLREFLQALLEPFGPVLFYVGGLMVIIRTVFRDANFGIYALIILAPMPNVWYKFQAFPLGKDLIDILVAATLIGIVVNKRGIHRLANGAFLIFFIIVNYISLWKASLGFDLPPPVTTSNPLLEDWKNYAEMIFLYFLAANCMLEEKEQKSALTLIAFVMLFICLREFRNFSEGGFFSYDRRVEGPFYVTGLNANHFGAFIAHYSALLLGLFLVDREKLRRYVALAAVLVGLHPLFFSYSRGAYIGAFMALLFFALVRARALLLLVGVLAITWQTVLPTTVVERITMTESSGGELEASAAERIELWNHAVGLFQDHPIFGIGFGAFGLTRPAGSLKDTHNFYIRMASEQGVIGLALFAVVLLLAFRSAWRLYRSAETNFHRGLGLGFAGCVIAVAFTNLFGDRWSYFALGAYFFILWGLVDRGVVLAKEAKEQKAAQARALPATGPVAASGPGAPSADGPGADVRASGSRVPPSPGKSLSY